MPQASRTFRIFVHSTFSDWKTERNALQQYVFPRRSQLCRFQASDLRSRATPVDGCIFGQAGNPMWLYFIRLSTVRPA
jgi:hypothetical protein